MVESFYAALGVDVDADDATVRRAYREAVKEHHPDVSDDPAAEQRFKQLTTARDVLLDADERARYDRLGHESYVSDHLDAPNWSGTAGAGTGAGATGDGRSTGRSRSTPGGRTAGADPTGRADPTGAVDPTERGDPTRDGTPGDRTTNRGTSGTEEATWSATGVDEPTSGSRRHRARAGRRRHVSTDPETAGASKGAGVSTGGGTGPADPTVDEPWQTASATYRRSEEASRAAAERSTDTSLAELVTGIGPWLVIHLVFIASAVATAVFTLTPAGASLNLSLPAFLAAILLFGTVVSLSILHLVSQVVS